MLRTHKVRIYPTKEQAELLEKSFGVARFAWNIALTEWKFEYTQYKSGKQKHPPNARKLRDKFTKHVKPQYSWISEVSKEVYANAILDLGDAYKNTFESGFGFPKYKDKKTKNSFTVVTNGKGRLKHIQNRLYIYKFRKSNHLKTAEFPRFEGEIKRVTISRKGDKYFASCLYEIDENLCEYKTLNDRVDFVGIDVGSRTLAHTSSNEEFKLSSTKKLDRRINRLQRKLSRQKRYSNNYKKTKTKLQNAYLKKTNKRLDDVHKITRYIVEEYKNIAIENLKVSQMIKNKYLSKTISESYYYEFRRQLEYKVRHLNEQGVDVNIFIVDPRNTSKICNNCGHLNNPKTSKTYRCKYCRSVVDRDYNASLNIRDRAFKRQNC